MKDRFQRNIDYMRMSITDLCNLRCRYCMPDGMTVQKVPMSEILTYEELAEIATAGIALGITKYKITGGEPLVRRGCTNFIRMLKEIPGIEQVTMTTNGVLLEEQVEALRAAGLDAVNVSLDTLKPEVFEKISGVNLHHRVMAGIDAAFDAGLSVKINTVLQKGMNDEEWLSILSLAKDRPIDVRFIEMMPIGYGKQFDPIYNDDLQAALLKIYPDIKKDDRIHGNGPATYMKIPGFKGSVGFIGAMHGRFCADCNRIRLTSTGKLKPCLCYGNTYDIRHIFTENPGQDSEEARNRQSMLIEAIRDAVENKPEKHCFEKLSEITEQKEMVEIGG